MNKRNAVIGAISGGIAGAVGAWLISDYDFSLLFVIFIGAFIGVCVGVIAKFIKSKKK